MEHNQICIRSFKQVGDTMVLYSEQFARHQCEKMILQSNKSEATFEIKLQLDEREEQIAFSMTDVIAVIAKETVRYDVWLVDADEQAYRVVYEKNQSTPIWKRYIYSERLNAESALCAALYFSVDNELMFVVRNDVDRDSTERKFQYEHKILKLKQIRKKIVMDVNVKFLEEDIIKINGAYLRLVSNEILHCKQGEIKRMVQRKENEYNFRIVLGQESLKDLETVSYRLYLNVENEAGQKISLLIDQVNQQLHAKIRKKAFPMLTKLEAHQMLMTAINKKGHVRWDVREDRKDKSKVAYLKYTMARVINKLGLNSHQKPMLIIFEKECMTAQDNGVSFYKYLQTLRADELKFDYCYVINKQSTHLDALQGNMDHVVYQYSLKYFLAMIERKSFLVSSEARSHIAGFGSTMGYLFRIGEIKKAVFLQHGVTAAKKVPFFSKGQNGESDIFCVCSDKEKDIIVSNLKYGEEQVIVTGFTRWDYLETGKTKRKILYMPTWRRWLEEIDEEKFVDSEYYQKCMAVLNDPLLIGLLEKNQTELIFCAHPKFASFFEDKKSDSPYVQITTHNKTQVNQLIVECAMIITDYSSVFWDFCYCEKPVILYQFDQKRYLAQTGSYIDFNEDFVGDVVLENEELVAEIAKYMENDFKMQAVHYENSKVWFKNRDTNNCKRVLTELERRAGELAKRKPARSYARILKGYNKQLQVKKSYADKYVVK